MNSNPVTEVPLRKRSTRYEFVVRITNGGVELSLYIGKSANSANSAYWQAVQTLTFLRANGKIELTVTMSEMFYGCFITEIDAGHVKLLHQASGECVGWLTGSWSGDHLKEKMLATVPGMLRPKP